MILDKAWIKIISLTGAVGVMGLLFSTLMLKLFSSEIVSLLGSERTFYIIILLIGAFAIGLIVAILKPNVGAEKPAPTAPTKNINLKYERSKHDGDNHF